VRTWAPRGETPLRFESFNWRSLSIIGRLSLRRFYFQIHRGSTKSAQVIDFIKHLQHHLTRRILIIWDGVAIHRSKEVQANIVTTKGKVQAERLLPYAPELNPVESMRAHLKSHEIGKLIANQAWELSFEATAELRKMRRRPSILAACFTQAELGPRCLTIARASTLGCLRL